MWAMIDDMFSSEFMFSLLSDLTSACCAQVMSKVFLLFREKGLFSPIWALSCEDRQTNAGLLFQGASHYTEV